MGLINWFKDKIILSMEHDLALVKVRLDGFEMQLDQLKGQIASVRSSARYKKQSNEEEQDERNEGPTAKDWDEIKTAFGGIPIELIEKYNRGRK